MCVKAEERAALPGSSRCVSPPSSTVVGLSSVTYINGIISVIRLHPSSAVDSATAIIIICQRIITEHIPQFHIQDGQEIYYCVLLTRI